MTVVFPVPEPWICWKVTGNLSILLHHHSFSKAGYCEPKNQSLSTSICQWEGLSGEMECRDGADAVVWGNMDWKVRHGVCKPLQSVYWIYGFLKCPYNHLFLCLPCCFWMKSFLTISFPMLHLEPSRPVCLSNYHIHTNPVSYWSGTGFLLLA